MKQNKKHGTAALIILALIALIIVPVSAETLTGTLGGSDDQFISYTPTLGGSSTSGGDGSVLYVNDIEYSLATESLVHFDYDLPTYYADAPKNGNTATFIARRINTTGPIVATGTIGYMRNYNFLGVEQLGYQYWIFNNWDSANLSTGDQYIYLTGYNYTAFGISDFGAATNLDGGITSGQLTTQATKASSLSGNIGYKTRGSYTRQSGETVFADYSFTSPSGIGIVGTVTKTHLGTTYPSKIYIYNATSNAILTSDTTVSSVDLVFASLTQPIKVSLIGSLGSVYNSSILFAPTVTPTPTTTWTDIDPIPAGYVRTWFRNVNGQAGGSIYNSNLMLRDVENNTWRNYTADLDGAAYIDTLPAHTVDGYGTATGFYSTSRLGLAAYPNGMWDLSLYPTGSLLNPGTGNVNLIITVNDKTTGLKLNSLLRIVKPDGSVNGESTGSSGSVVTVVPNVSYILVTATKTGYESATKGITTSSFGPDSLQIELTKTTVTPVVTATPLPGQLTPAPTQDPNDPSLHGGDTSFKAQEMMNWLAMNGMDLVQLCFLVTVLALLGVKLGK